jgi:hypothetical protein
VLVAAEVAELVDEHRAQLRPVPVLLDVERDRAQLVVLRVAVVLELVDPGGDGVLVDRQLAPADVDVALARVHAPVLDGDLPGGLEGGAVDRPALVGRGCGVCS